ncbi:uncharacterized protein BDR25DRAFT_307390 [Lindgomyces ingoldianus]|uniref:Uncharacterized protein n=1 Tax=Lindgomyces ingoldianus TaxID=673940 RepID=A0ACB6QD53_9PLEO|nr:uncharacterized protein BDR25DRAFT_307390 [Lindgomyces ingoldianus]KAF2464076.1 hypothetical protein BDR25DRAFT_307390 [Lindgomyces ingoldianus]
MLVTDLSIGLVWNAVTTDYFGQDRQALAALKAVLGPRTNIDGLSKPNRWFMVGIWYSVILKVGCCTWMGMAK